MVSPLCFISLILPLVVICVYCPGHIAAIRFETKADAALVQSICNESQDPDYCNKTLAVDPRVEAANMDGLALISISLTIDQVQGTLDSIPGILGQISYPIGKQRLGVCQTDYNNALGQFHGAYSSSSAKAYWDVIERVRNGTNKVIDCENIYKRDPISVSPIAADNHNVVKLSELILIIVDRILPH